MKNALKEKMLAGERTLGTFFETGSTTVAQCLGLAGLDYIIIDNEHGPFEAPEDIQKVRGIGPSKYEKMKDRIAI